MPDLFNLGIVPGLKLVEEIISASEERDLIACIDATNLSPFRFQQWTGKRLTRSYGWSYDFQTRAFELTEPIPDWLLPMKAKAATFGGLPSDDFVQALIIRYDPGAGIGWHKDRPVFSDVVGLSLGHRATLRLRRRHVGGFERTGIALEPRSMYHLSGEVRHHWEHSISPLEVPRWSITFRSLAKCASAMTR